MAGETFATIKATQLAYRTAVPDYFPTAATVNRKSVSEFTYDFTEKGGAVGNILLGRLLPNIKVTKVTYDVLVGLASAGADAGIVGVSILKAGDLIAESALTSNMYDVGNNQNGYANGTEARAIPLLDKTDVWLNIKNHALLTGKFVIKIQYR